MTYQHLEEFLIAAGKKEKVTISAREVGKEYYELKDSLKESFYIQRSGWGHLRLSGCPHGAGGQAPAGSAKGGDGGLRVLCPVRYPDAAGIVSSPQ